MTKATAKKAAAKKAAAKTAPEESAPAAPAAEESASIEQAAPLDPPAADDSFATEESPAEPGAPAMGDEAAPEDGVGDVPDVTAKDAEAEASEGDQAAEDGKADGDAEEEDGDALPDPATVSLEPPAEKPKEDEAEEPDLSLTAVAAERLKNIPRRQQALVRDEHGEPIEDTDGLFVGPGVDGRMRATRRLHQHTTATAHDRPVTTLLIARGQSISEHGARSIIASIQAERA